MNKKTLIIAAMMAAGYTFGVNAQTKVNDSNTPLHLLKPDYSTPYGIKTVEEVKSDMDRILRYLEVASPAVIEDKNTGKEITDYKKIDANSRLKPGDFRLTSYEWGVTYSAMIAAAEATGDKAYMDYVDKRFKLLAESAPYFKKVKDQGGRIDGNMSRVLSPGALDDSGTMCAAMIKAMTKGSKTDLMPLIDNYINYIMTKEHRLSDGTFARNRPFFNSVWLDDMFMGIPPVAWYAKVAGSDAQKYSDEAAKQIEQFAQRMWVADKNLFRHGWAEAMDPHPAFFWGRANGWALLTMCEVLDVLPENHPKRAFIMDLFKKHLQGLAERQSKDGFWHQLLDRNDSYHETSATAIYVYCMAHAINRGWVSAMTYGPIATLGWNAVATKINDKGQVEDVCVGTGMGFDPAFYYYRPVNVYAAHGYGPAIWAGAEMINLIKKQNPKSNDSATLFYKTPQKTNRAIFSETK